MHGADSTLPEGRNEQSFRPFFLPGSSFSDNVAIVMELAITLDQRSTLPLHRQLYNELRDSILSGRLQAGARVPSTRSLAGSLGISRATVTQSYEQLISEGYLQTILGSGTLVSTELPEQLLHAPPVKAAGQPASNGHRKIRLSAYGAALQQVVREPEAPKPLLSFKYCRPAIDEFPVDLWRRLLLRHYRSKEFSLLDYAEDGRGYEPLRKAIAAYLARARAVRCEPDQVLIVNGSQQALHLIAQVLLDNKDQVVIEEPGYLGARHVFQMHGARLLPVRVDAGGMMVENLPAANVKLAYVSPSHQFPTGAILSLQRRLELLAWAEKQGAMIIEDDYDSEFRYGGRPIPALQGLEHSDAVIYVGTFSKVLFPGLRIGYLVAPRPLINPFERAKWLMDRHTPLLEQRALTDFIEEGHFDRHLRRMRTLYDRRRQALVRSLTALFGDRVTIVGENSGMHLMVRFNNRLGNDQILQRAEEAGVGLTDARLYYLRSGGEGEFVFGYSALSERKIQEAIRRLAKVLN